MSSGPVKATQTISRKKKEKKKEAEKDGGIKNSFWAWRGVQWLRALAALPEEVRGLIPSIHRDLTIAGNTYMWYTNMHADKTPAHININLKKKPVMLDCLSTHDLE